MQRFFAGLPDTGGIGRENESKQKYGIADDPHRRDRGCEVWAQLENTCKTKPSQLERRVHMPREQTTIRLPSELKEQLQREADRMGIIHDGLAVSL